jgi:hypothetical protein
MGILVNILAFIYVIELCTVSFLLGCKYRNEQAMILDPYDVAKMAKSIDIETDWEECYRAALVLKQAGFGMVVYDKDDVTTININESSGLKTIHW